MIIMREALAFISTSPAPSRQSLTFTMFRFLTNSKSAQSRREDAVDEFAPENPIPDRSFLDMIIVYCCNKYNRTCAHFAFVKMSLFSVCKLERAELIRDFIFCVM